MIDHITLWLGAAEAVVLLGAAFAILRRLGSCASGMMLSSGMSLLALAQLGWIGFWFGVLEPAATGGVSGAALDAVHSTWLSGMVACWLVTAIAALLMAVGVFLLPRR